MPMLQATLAACAVLVALWFLLLLGLLALGRRTAARELASFVPDCLVLFRRLLADPRVPRRGKLALALLVAYLAMPFDLVPDFIPVAGQLDDAILVAAAIAYVVRRAGRDVVEELWPGSERGLKVVLALSK
ncbi:MAG TPA: DUF1232 domain-containing protein [Gaiellaceae bacterium]